MGVNRDIFKGLSAFPITPASSDGTVDTEALTRVLKRLDIPGIDSVGLLGSTGNYAYLPREQRQRAINTAVQTLQGRKPLIVSAGALRTDDAQLLARDAEEAGAKGILLAPVSYNQLTDEEVFQHYEAVAGATALPICIYNTPSTTGFHFSDALLARVAALPTVVALKQPSPTSDAKQFHQTLASKLPSDHVIGYSADWLIAEPLLAGGSTWFSAIAGVLPGPSVALMQSIRKKDADEIKRINSVLQPVWELFQEFGDLRVIFAFANELGVVKAAPPRPILPVPAQHHERIRKALAAVEKGF